MLNANDADVQVTGKQSACIVKYAVAEVQMLFLGLLRVNHLPQNVALVNSVNLQAALWPNREFFLLMFNLHGLRFGVQEGRFLWKPVAQCGTNCGKGFPVPPPFFFST